MPVSLSPDVTFTETDLTNVVPQVSTTNGGIAGVFQWGPLNEIVTIDSENSLVRRFGKPPTSLFEDWFVGAQFLAYGSGLQTVRITDEDTAKNAISKVGGTAILIKNKDHYDSQYSAGQADVGGFAAKYCGELGNSLKVSLCAHADAYQKTGTASSSGVVVTMASLHLFAVAGSTVINSSTGVARRLLAVVDASLSPSAYSAGTPYAVGATVTYSAVKYVCIQAGTGHQPDTSPTYWTSYTSTDVGVLASAFSPDLSSASVKVRWEYADYFAGAPGTSLAANGQNASGDELHVIVVDEDGAFTGIAGTVLEQYAYVSRAANVKKDSGGSNYYASVINDQSAYIWWMDHPVGGTDWGTAVAGTVFAGTVQAPVTASLFGGLSANSTADAADYTRGYALFASQELVDVSHIMMSKADAAVIQYVVTSICEVRKDCIAYISPRSADVVGVPGSELANSLSYRSTTLNINSSFAFMDSGWKYTLDRYNDTYRWIPLNGDTAGLATATDTAFDPWFSPAGYNRGQIKNCVKLAWSPGKADRDALYSAQINPVYSARGQGTVLFGDKTMLTKPSAFDRLPVRRLFIILEQSISRAAKAFLFEINDAYTRATFRSTVEPFLAEVKARRGVDDYLVVCDATNNTPQVVSTNQFVGDIYIRPNYSINYIRLNFVAVKAGVDFTYVTTGQTA